MENDPKQTSPPDAPAPDADSAASRGASRLFLNPLTLFVLIAIAFLVTLLVYPPVVEKPKVSDEEKTARVPERPTYEAVPPNRYETTEIPGAAKSKVPPPAREVAWARTPETSAARNRQNMERQARKQKIKSISNEIYAGLRKEEATTTDTIYMKSGKQIDCTILNESLSHYRVRYGEVVTSIEKEKVDRLEKRPPRALEIELRRLALERAIKIVDEGLVRHEDDWTTPEERELRMQASRAKVGIERTRAPKGAGSNMVYEPAPRPARGGPYPVRVRGGIDFSSVTVYEGRGVGSITLGAPRCTKEFIKSKLGEPDIEKGHLLDYNVKYGIEFVFAADRDMLIEMHLNRSFKGKLSSGVTTLSSMEEVFEAYGEPVGEEEVDDMHLDYREYRDRTLYRKDYAARLSYKDLGLMFWFSGDEINQIVVHLTQTSPWPR
ncbi:MAG: hypothetical protein HQ583_04670 [Candidatus Abyssubacteria bacterium]|nr:hypothetical protein [Candidatus Abyssubacteria bacterium]